MNIGYSLIFGELFTAKELSYQDTKDFSIVCPSCNQSIFKTVRPKLGSDIPSEYLCHHKSTSFMDECDRRVSSIDIHASNSEWRIGRGQSKKEFDKIFKRTFDSACKNVFNSITPRDENEWDNYKKSCIKQKHHHMFKELINILQNFETLKDLLIKKVPHYINGVPSMKLKSKLYVDNMSDVILKLILYINNHPNLASHVYCIVNKVATDSVSHEDNLPEYTLESIFAILNNIEVPLGEIGVQTMGNVAMLWSDILTSMLIEINLEKLWTHYKIKQ